MSSEDKQNLYDPPPSTDAPVASGPLYDPHISPGPSASTAAYPPPPDPAPQYQPHIQPAPSYQPVPVAQQSSNTTVAVVNTAPTRPTFTMDETMPPNYLVLNIVTLLCCCWLFGLIGLIYSFQVESEWSRGNRYGAHNASRTAKNWGMAGIITGIFLTAGSVLLAVILAVVNVSNASNSSS